MSENKDDVLKKLAHMETLEKFLCGEAQMAKTWFGDKHPSKVGLFWWRTVLRKRFADVAALIRSQSSTIESLRAKADDHDLALAAMDEIRKACKEIMGGNCAFIDDDFARALLTLRDERESLRRELDAMRLDAERYRWLRHRGCGARSQGEDGGILLLHFPTAEQLGMAPERIDYSIDAAISEARGRE